jgi:site-specific DNA-methyltransferase (adenine-specific)
LNVFDDTWHWGKIAEQTYYDITTNAPLRVAQLVDSFRQFIGTNQMMAYLVMMTARLVELHRVLKPTGSLYLHCDPTASHYLKIVFDTIFGANNFRNEIIWSYKRYTASSNRFQRLHDVLILYGKTEQVIFNDLREDYGDKSGIADSHYKQDENGKWFRWQKRRGQEPYKIYLSEGRRMGDVWEIPIINASSKERLGYPTQKPLALLERIIQASSNPGDIALDPFCGCGTAVAASEKLGRRWIGIDVTHLAISLIKYRMKDMFPSCQYSVIGEPEDLGSAHQLARDDRYQFQWWALSLVRARPIGGEAGNKRGKMGSDRGIDGEINFFEGLNKPSGWVIVQVKSGHVKVGDVRDLRGAVEREGAAIGVLITLEAPTSEMIKEVAVA